MKRKWTEHRTTRADFEVAQVLYSLESRLGSLKFQQIIHAQRRVEIGAHTLDMLDEYERLLRRTS